MAAIIRLSVASVAMLLISMTTLRFSPPLLLNWGQDATGHQDVPKPVFKVSLTKPPVSPGLIEPAVKPCLPKEPLIDQATHPKYTKVVVLDRESLYHQGDVLTARVVARDKEGGPKTYGGDFFRARLVSSDRSLQASSAGHVTDHCNGTYTVQFPLYWVGGVSIKIQLVHPSEAVEVLRRLRETPNTKIFYCTFDDSKTKASEKRRCYSSTNPNLPPDQLCDFSKQKVNATWICQKPDKLPCSTIGRCKWDPDQSYKRAEGLVSKKEKILFKKPYLETELELDTKEPIRVLESERATPEHLPLCTGNATDSQASFGYWSGKVWKSSACNVRVFTKEDIRRCLANKTVYMEGDSTIAQWYARLVDVVLLKHITTADAAIGRHKPSNERGEDNQWNISLSYRFHHFPRQGSYWTFFNEARYTADVLDAFQGGPNMVVVLGLWAHFAAEPLDMIRSRLYAIRGAIHRLLRRGPGTRVFVRTGTTREHAKQKMSFYLTGSDWLNYQVTEVIREVFRADPDVVVLDTWDMSVCQWGPDSIHPDKNVVGSQLNIMLSHICPK
ncbi:NXPE family member 3-like [Branchiostoma floridae]|uniref:NXPE family member 3-like n=1 Tax=Branchiostoma floridae TaxID=7739 RepID=A0A9J7KRW3_BRAFL|nr:NXPE family member 3-like [Branchiostoma floridae]XP_035669027.1 NXPE family member 3-like [Branchiostoma floridae]